MKILLLILAIYLVGCSTARIGDDVDRNSKGYLAANEWIGRDPIKEFEENKKENKLRLYALGLHGEGSSEIIGLSQEEVDMLIDEEKVDYEIIHEDVYPFYVGDRKFKPHHYWAALDDFMTAYNRLVLKEIELKKQNKAVEAKNASAPVTSP